MRNRVIFKKELTGNKNAKSDDPIQFDYNQNSFGLNCILKLAKI